MLPNNALLEMRRCVTGSRAESNVTIAVQFESGERKMADFQPSDSLFEVISTVGMPAVKRGHQIVAVYMQSEIVGEEALSQTTLRR